MRSLLTRTAAAGALTAVTALSALSLAGPASAATPDQTTTTAAVSTAAGPTTQAAFFRGYYASAAGCVNAGEAGIRNGRWSAYICIFDVSVRFYALYA